VLVEIDRRWKGMQFGYYTVGQVGATGGEEEEEEGAGAKDKAKAEDARAQAKACIPEPTA
jgi:hypothetical protein